MSGVDLSFAIGLPPKKAIEYFEGKGYAIGFDWTDVWHEAHAKSFTVAGVMKQDVLQDIRNSLTDAMKNGESFTKWRDKLLPELEKKGWLGKGTISDPTTGEVSKQLAPHRFETIYRTNMHSAMMAGRYQSQRDNIQYRPYATYSTVGDNRVRPKHAELEGFTARLDDPVWEYLYPPNDWMCRCSVRTYSEKDIVKKDISVFESSDKDFVQLDQPVNKAGDARPTTAFKNPLNGKLFTTGAGFNFNAGKARYLPNLDEYSAPIAQKFIRESIGGPDFKRNYQKFEAAVQKGLADGVSSIDIRKKTGQGFKWPVARMNDADAALFGAETKTVLLSDDTLIKQIAHRQGQGFSAEHYLLVESTIEQAAVIGRENDQVLLFFKEHDRFYQATVKMTADKKEMYLVSFYKINDKDVLKKMAKLDIIKNELN